MPSKDFDDYVREVEEQATSEELAQLDYWRDYWKRKLDSNDDNDSAD